MIGVGKATSRIYRVGMMVKIRNLADELNRKKFLYKLEDVKIHNTIVYKRKLKRC